MSNMDEFNRITVLALGTLYQAFPQAVRLQVEVIDENPDSNTIKNFYYTVYFLSSEGYIKYEGAQDEGKFFIEVMLTMKGLRVLRLVPDAIQENLNLGESFVSLLKTNAKEADEEALKVMVNRFVSESQVS